MFGPGKAKTGVIGCGVPERRPQASPISPAQRAALAGLPKVDAVLARPEVQALLEVNEVPRWALCEAIRAAIGVRRAAILAGAALAHEALDNDGEASLDSASASAPELAPAKLLAGARALTRPSLAPVINATGVVIHTNLGRAPLSRAALDRVVAIARGYSNLEYDLSSGKRGSRHGHPAALVTALTGAEDAVVVNNNAAAVLLALTALASDREVIVSRGELVEIGGSFRIPDVMRLSGARLVEVGTTNKTRADDYQRAIGPDTGMLLKVHRSNFAIVGFSEEVSLPALVAQGRAAHVPTMMDLGAGSLVASAELQALGLAPEPSVGSVIAAGVDVVAFSGDKLMGGPQAGILCGRQDLIDRVRRHPMMRALRPDKMTLAALEASLAAYRDRPPATLPSDIPALAMLSRAEAEVRALAERVVGEASAAEHAPDRAAARLAAVPCRSTVGGGALPTVTQPSWAVALTPQAGASAEALAAQLRAAPVPVIGRIVDDRVLLDMRTVLPDDIDALIDALVGVLSPAPRTR